jgi:hypothetical protein
MISHLWRLLLLGASLEKAQNALADSLDELLDLFLAGGWRGVEYPALAVPVVAVDAVEE